MLEISLNNVIKSYGFTNILKGASLEITTGERVAIVGRNGSGKTTILKLITGEEAPTQGTISIRRGATVGYLEQIPDLTDTAVTTRQVLMEAFGELFAIERRLRELEAKLAEGGGDTERLLRSYAHQQERYETLGGYAIEENIDRVTTGFGLTEFLDRPFNVLSGGQKTITALARTILGEPDILLLDEPTNHLDVRYLEWFESFLAKYRGTVVIVSHDRYFLDKVATRTILLESGVCRGYSGNYSFSIQERERELMVEFAQYKNQQKMIAAMKAAIKRYRMWAAQADNEAMYRKAKELEKRLEKIEVLDRPQMEKPKLPVSFSGERTGKDVIRLKAMSLMVGDLPLLEDVSLTVFYRERACLMGDNGSGKTCLIRALLGELMPLSGEIALATSVHVGYIPQEIRFEDDTASMLEAFKAEYICTEGQARNILAKYGFMGDNVYKRVSALSGGEKVLLKLAALVQKEVNLLILDEPTNHVDIATREILEDALLDFPATLLFVSHDRYFIRKIADRILHLHDMSVESFSGDYDMWRRGKGGT